VVIKQQFQYRHGRAGQKGGIDVEQNIVLQSGKRFFISSDRMMWVNSSETMFFPAGYAGHIKHNKGDTFSEIYLSYREENGRKNCSVGILRGILRLMRVQIIGANKNKVPERLFRAYHLRDPKTGRMGVAGGDELDRRRCMRPGVISGGTFRSLRKSVASR